MNAKLPLLQYIQTWCSYIKQGMRQYSILLIIKKLEMAIFIECKKFRLSSALANEKTLWILRTQIGLRKLIV
jgi:hypothetical protein